MARQDALVTAVRDLLHETSANRCDRGSDLCDTWADAIVLAEHIRARARRYVNDVVDIYHRHGQAVIHLSEADYETVVREVAMATVPVAVRAREALRARP